MVYDSARARVVLFGGRDPMNQLLNDIWEFDTAAQSWSAVVPASVELPEARADFGMAYDAGRGRVVVYGGVVEDGINSATWEWDGATRLWSQHAVGAAVPGALWGAELAYDPNLHQVILFGGEPGLGSPGNATTYAWDGADWAGISSSGPVSRVEHAMSADSARSAVTLFGGRAADGTALTDTWEWNGATWIQVGSGTPGATPPVTTRAALAFDAGRRVQVLFGGEGSGETWEWNGDAWSPCATDSNPSPRATAMAYDAAQSRFILFGGSDGNAALADTWLGRAVAPVASTETRITAATPASSTYGQAVTLSVVVENLSDGTTPEGFVEVFDNGISLGSAPLVAATASLQTTSIGAGSRSLTATYTPTGPFEGSTSPVFPYTVNQAVVSSTLTLTPTARQYSDLVTFEVTVGMVNGEPPAESVTFKVGTQEMGTAPLVPAGTVARARLSDVPLVEPTPWGTPPTGQMKPAPLGRATAAVFNNVSPNYSVNNPPPKSLTITKEEARATYTGTLLASTANASATTAAVRLSATIRDISATADGATDMNAGDIRHAIVTFINRDTGYAISPAIAVTLPNPAETRIGEVAYDWTVNLDTANSQTFRIGTRVDNYYTRDNAAEDALVTVSRGFTTGFATGGGYLTMLTSGGLKPGTPGSLNTFGFGVKYSGAGSKPSGHFHTMIRSGGAVYAIKGTTFTSVAVSGNRATLRGVANIYTVTTGSTLLDTAATFEVTLTDNGEPGTADSIAITIRNSAGLVWFSSNLAGEQTLTAGNVKLP